MRFQVPQNVQREDRILGPLTMKQLIIAVVGLGFAWVMWATMDPTIATPIIIVMVAVTACVLFVRINEMSFYQYLMELALFFLKPRVRAWKKGAGDISMFDYVRTSKAVGHGAQSANVMKEKSTQSLAELSLTLDTRGGRIKTAQEQKREEMEEHLSDAEILAGAGKF